MRLTFFPLAAAVVLTFSACGSSQYKSGGGESTANAAAYRSAQTAVPASGGNRQEQQVVPSDVTLDKASAVGQDPAATERKIIRNAELSIESQNPEDSFRKVASLAESKNGFVVTSEAVQPSGEAEPERMTVTVVVRVPAAQFEATVEEIRRFGSRVLQDKRTGQDVTEEYIDLQARLQAKRALESQFLEIMKQANKVSEALEVQRQLAEVRSEIEQLEGRRRFLENQSSLSTIRVSIIPPVQIIERAGGGGSIKEALRDGLGAAMLIVLTLVRVILASLPLLILLGLPSWLLVRYLLRRNRRPRINGTPVA